MGIKNRNKAAYESISASRNKNSTSLSERISKRLSPAKLRFLRKEGSLSPCKRLRFFMQYSDRVSSQLLDIAELIQEVPP